MDTCLHRLLIICVKRPAVQEKKGIKNGEDADPAVEAPKPEGEDVVGTDVEKTSCKSEGSSEAETVQSSPRKASTARIS